MAKFRRLILGLGTVLGGLLLLYAVDRSLHGHRAVQTFNASAKTPRAGPELRIISYNIAHGRGPHDNNLEGGGQAARAARLAQIAALLKAQRADVVVLNEVDFDSTWSYGVNQAEIIAKAAGFAHRAEQRNLDLGLPMLFSLRFGNAILSRYPLKDCALLDYPAYSKTEAFFAGKKKGLVCTVQAGRPFRLLAVHLEHRNEPVRVRSAVKIDWLARTQGPPVVAVGDFNSTRLGFPGARTDEAGRTAISWLLSQGTFIAEPTTSPGEAQLTFSSKRPRFVIDWVLIPPKWCVEKQRVDSGTLSDHRMVVAEVRPDCGQRSVISGDGG